jgi:hypothetical protein
MVQPATRRPLRPVRAGAGLLILEIRVRVPGGPLQDGFEVGLVLRRQNRFQQTREALVQVVLAQ